MKVVLLAGGLGTRISEESHLKPKPMIEIGGKPILWHIMKYYSQFGFHEFVICLGYKQYVVKEFFADYFLHTSDVTFDLANNKMEVHNNYSEPWKVTLVDTGLYTMTGGRIKINYVTAKNIFPVSWENGKIQEVIFAFPKTYCTKRYLHLQHHKVGGDGNYRIENTVLLVTAGSTCGQELTEEEWQEVPIFAGLPEEIETGSAEPQFVIDRLNMVNNADMEDEENPMGISLFANSIDILRKIDTEYDSYANEFGLGRKRIFVAPEMLTDENGNKVFDENDTVFYSLPEETLKDTNPIYEVNMELRTEQHSKALNDDLNYLSMKCGFGTERYKFEKGTVATATQVISENSDMYRSLCKHEIVLQSALEELIRIIIRLGITLGEPLKEDVEVTINFDDSIIEDKEAERQRDRQDVSMGAMGVDEYRAKWFGETLEQARKNLPVQNNVME